MYTQSFSIVMDEAGVTAVAKLPARPLAPPLVLYPLLDPATLIVTTLAAGAASALQEGTADAVRNAYCS
jgi:hypothetical protein